MDLIYLDNNATTRPSPQVVTAVREAVETLWANPSSVHRAGQGVRMRLELARAAVAILVGCKDREIVFTSGGTESNNMAIRGVLGWCGSEKVSGQEQVEPAVLITTRVEHSATRAPAEQLVASGIAVEYVRVDLAGRVDLESLEQALRIHGRPGANVLVSIQWVNNETGVVQPVASIARLVAEARVQSQAAPGVRPARARITLHIDASQAVGKIPVSLAKVPIDLMTFSAHKFHGLKGIGSLYVRTGVKLKPQILGGPQERDRRAGTENTVGIIAMGAAAQHAREYLEDAAAIRMQRALRDRFESKVVEALTDTVVHSVASGNAVPPPECVDPLYAPDGRVWNTTNLGFPRFEAEAILLGLSEKGVCASAGAACSSGSLEPSPVLLAMGILPAVAHGSVRFSLSRYTTEGEIDEAVRQVELVVKRLRKTL